MEERTISLRTDLVERLERMANTQGRSIEDVLDSLLNQPAPLATNWALELVHTMASADIVWQDVSDASATSRERFKDNLFEMWQLSQNVENDDE